MADFLSIDGVTKRFGGVQAVHDVSFSVAPGSIVGPIGPNGAGKTTLFNLLTGFLVPDAGTIRWRGRDLGGLAPHRIARLGIGRTFQTLRVVRDMSALENVLLGFQCQRGERLLPALLDPRIGREDRENRDRAMALLARVGLAEAKKTKAGALSYGQQKLLSLLMCLALDAELLLLDEPVAGISPVMTEVLLAHIRDLKSAERSVLIIEHNIEAVKQVADRLIVMAGGRKIAEGRPDAVLADAEVLRFYLTPVRHA